jgi:hypothetical protein
MTSHDLPRLGAPAGGNGAGPGHLPRTRDDTTRYLCAAAHLDPDYANKAIREFLVEDTRPVPVTPGVDAAAVLGEAVAARTRRKLRDIALLLLLIAILFLAPTGLLVGWVVAAFLVAGAATAQSVQKVGAPVKPVVAVVGGALVVVAVMMFGPQLMELLSSSGTDSSGAYGFEPEPSTSVGATVGVILVVAAMLAVLLADRFVVWKHLNQRFWPNRLSAQPLRSEARPVFEFSPNHLRDQLRRYTNPRVTMANLPADQPGQEPPAPLIVYRSFVPFVGAGTPEDPWSIAVPLERLSGVEPTLELTTEALYAGIRAEVESLRGAGTLAPGRRLRELAVNEVVIASADELIDHLAEPSAADFLQRPGQPPFTMIRGDRVRSIRSDPLEWARYYQCYQVETWDRDLVVTVFVHVAVGRGALYVEWTPCVLRPIKMKYQRIDQMSRSPLRPVGQALLDLFRLPTSIPGRLAHTLTFMRPLPRDKGVLSPDMYGVSSSLRELAADRRVHNYFQLADIDRYLKMLESRLTLAVSRMMRAAGYSPASFDEQAAAVVNNNIHIGGSVSGNVVAGTGNKVRSGAEPRDTQTARTE